MCGRFNYLLLRGISTEAPDLIQGYKGIYCCNPATENKSKREKRS